MKYFTLAVALLTACHRNRGADTAAASCEPVREAAVATGDVASLAGEHEITFVVMSGARAGETASGRLTLRHQADSLKRGPWSPAEQAFIGRFDMDPSVVGAVPMGSGSVDDPRAPGLAVYVAAAAPGTASVTARIGSLTNGRGQPAFEAGHFALHVRSVSANGFAGAWSSGDGRQEVAAGHFCARRL